MNSRDKFGANVEIPRQVHVSNICQKRVTNLLFLMVFDSAVTAEENRENGHNNEAAVRDNHPLERRRHPHGRRILILGQILARLSRNLVHRACHLEQ